MVITAISLVFRFGSILFGLGFLAPLIATLIANAGIDLPFGSTPLLLGLLLGGGLGLLAQLRGTWLWPTRPS